MKRILDRIESPQDLKKIPLRDLPRLAQEIRKLILEVVSHNGGHLAPNLGVVEIAIAVHYVFNAPRDKIIWDVGHQCYPHKILTGRKSRFHTLRQYKGICGFPSREESDYDVYNTGHASTALSAALGMAAARERTGDDYEVVAVVGDGSLTGGVAWEALNQIGHLKKKLIIILNYNEMSISPNVGALSRYLSYIVSGQYILRMKDLVKSILKVVPAVGVPMIKVARAVEDAVKKAVFPGLVFERLGIKYIDPVQGHNLDSLIEAFERAKSYHGPILVHCVTRKGKGYRPARNNPEKFHGTSPFDIKTGKPLNEDSTPTYSAVFGETMVEVAREDERVVAITAAMPDGTGLRKFATDFPQRFYDVGIAEQHAVDFATGLALSGLKPVVAIYSTFLQRAYDQLYHDVCLMDVPILFALDRSGIVSDDGPTHQGVNDIVYLRHLPHMIVMAPKDENELRHMVRSAISYPHPTAIRYPKGKGWGVPLDEESVPIPPGQSEPLKEGENLIVALGSMVYPSLRVAERLEKEGFSFAVLNARFVKPLDEKMILSLVRPGKIVISVEEGVLDGGFGSAVRELLDREKRFSVKFKRIGLPLDVYPVGKADLIKRLYSLDEDGIFRQIMGFIQKSEKN
ncbi:MAG: 1-deoxy-D-xylulose-5-phosphate synthase [Candidatus Aminicenantales bacterium]